MGDGISNRSPTDAWVGEALDRIREETASFGRTFAAFLLHPGRSAAAWQGDERRFMNPLGFAGSSAGAYWAIISVLAALLPSPGSGQSESLGTLLTTAIGPYLHYGLLGIAMHLALRALGSRRSVYGSLGVAFFTGGSIGMVGALPATAAARWFAHARGTAMLELRTGDLVPLVLLARSPRRRPSR
jgi:hypothetical protein